MQELVEMSLVRNLGLHNRWEVDERYMARTRRVGSAAIGELRIMSLDELQTWQSLISRVLIRSSSECAQIFKDAPDFSTL